jgi:PAS domain S-box-containing protein
MTLRIKFFLWFLAAGALTTGVTCLIAWNWAQANGMGGAIEPRLALSTILLTTLPLLAALSVISYIFAGRLTSRLENLASMAEKIKSENPGYKLQVRGNDEIARVTASLNEISEYLAVTYRELHQAAENYRNLSTQLDTGDAIKSAMLSTALDAIVTIDAAGKVHDFNAASEKLFGYTREEVLGQDMAELIVPEKYREAHREGMRHWTETGEANVFGIRIEIEAQNRSGAIFPIELAITPLGLENETYFTGFIRDITEQKNAEMELRLAASAFEAREGIFITDEESRIIRANSAILNMTGYTREEIIGESPDRLFQMEERTESSGQASWDTFLSSNHVQCEASIIPREGEAYPVWLSLSRVTDDAGVISNHVAHVIDMTERKRFEQALEMARNEAEKANRTKSQFLANMSHEIRTPLNAIINLNSLLMDSQLDHEQQQLAIAANQGGKALSTLVDDILDFSTIEAGALRLLYHPFNLHELVAGLKALFHPQAMGSGLEFRASVDSQTPKWVSGDEIRLRQVLINLLGNALKFTDSGFVELTVEPSKDRLIIFRVRDTGIGVSNEDATLIFSEFSQADDSLTRRHKGAGLGLTISQRLVEKMKGVIHYESAPESGSIFWFEIPLEPAAEPEQIPSSFPAHALLNARVLVVEDSQANQLVARAILEKAGCKVELASNGQDAIEAAREHHFDAILMDLSMPVMDGLQATRLIRELNGGSSSVPILAMTANVFAEDRIKCMQAGMDDFITKPVKQSKLLAKLAHWLDPERTEPKVDEELNVDYQSMEVLDEEQLAKMENETSTGLMTEVIGIFLEETQEHLDALKAAGNQPDSSTLISEAHAIKSSSSTFGASRLYEAARKVESLARQGRHEQAIKATQGIFEAAEETLTVYAHRFISDYKGQSQNGQLERS